MKQVLTILHAENRLSPSVLSLVKGGDVPLNPICRLDNNCLTDECISYEAKCVINRCGFNNKDCEINDCQSNCKIFFPLCKGDINPNPSCPKAVYP